MQRGLPISGLFLSFPISTRLSGTIHIAATERKGKWVVLGSGKPHEGLCFPVSLLSSWQFPVPLRVTVSSTINIYVESRKMARRSLFAGQDGGADMGNRHVGTWEKGRWEGLGDRD